MTRGSLRGRIPEWLTGQPIAHRGLHDVGAPENTLPAFEAAIVAGYPIELDVHVLPDGEVIVFHDEDLQRAANLRRSLREENRESIRQHRLFGSCHGIPTLREVLALVRGKVPLLVEIKARRESFAVRAIVQSIAGYPGPLAIQSFDPWTLAELRRLAPQIWRGQLSGALWEDGLPAFQRFAAQRLLTLAVSQPAFVNYDLRGLPDAWVSVVTRLAALPLLCWTVRSEQDRAKAEALGINYVFDGVRPG